MSTDDFTEDEIEGQLDGIPGVVREVEIVPYRMQLNFTGAHKDITVMDDIIDAVIEEAENRGIFFEFAHLSRMDPGDIIPGSPLDQVVTGR